MSKAQEGGAVVQADEVVQLQLHLDHRVSHHGGLPPEVIGDDVSKGDCELFALLVVLDYCVLELGAHKAVVGGQLHIVR